MVTNGKLGVEELFGDLLPTYDDAVTLTNVLQYWLEHDEERELKVSELRDIVKRKHTYDHRAEVVYRALMPEKFAVRIAIKISATVSAKEKWGDYHFAESLAKSLRKLNFIVTVDCLESWNRGTSESDDVVIVLRGLRSYSPRPNQKNILWLISHPREVPMSEFDAYDHIFVASSCFAKKLENSVDVPVDVLLQCSDTDRFRPSRTDLDELERSEKPLFVGNSRGIFRPVVKWCMELEKDIDIYGGGWEQFVTDERLRGTLIPNEVLSGFYEYSIAVLCDHWDDMKRDGFISNRAFDVLAAGGQLVIDDVRDVDKVLPGGYKKFKNREELDNILRNLEFDTTDTRFERAAWVKKFHSFDVRASILSEKILDLLKGG